MKARIERKRAALQRASHILSSQEAAAFPSPSARARPSETEEDSSDSEEEAKEKVQAASGRNVHFPTGRTQGRPALVGGFGDGPKALSAMGALRAIPSVECPEVAYQQGAADLCAAYGLASAMHEYGDTSGAAAIAACAPLRCMLLRGLRGAATHTVRALQIRPLLLGRVPQRVCVCTCARAL